MRIYAVAIQKGGTGKTATTANLAAGLAIAGGRVLAVDADPQGHLTQHLLGKAGAAARPSLYEVLTGKAKAAEAIIQAERIQSPRRKPAAGSLAVLPANGDLAAAELEIADLPGRERILAGALAELRGYDTCLIDCPPSLTLLTIEALTAAGGLIIPSQCEPLALYSLSLFMDTLDMVKRNLNPRLEIFGIVGTRFDGRRRVNHEVLDKLREHFSGQVFKTVIRENVSIAEAIGHGRPIFAYRAGSHGAADYATLTREFMKREKTK
ncbi:MAG: Chromosome partitioning protein ParA [Candidatus Aminicenantes bacterium ADurb.Bin147]|nr:MAG: Chromosome partitioning protein ParA [Candidatus Aminicenantes bacterium ADurb.Bin147]